MLNSRVRHESCICVHICINAWKLSWRPTGVHTHSHTTPCTGKLKQIAGTNQKCALVPSQTCTSCHRVVPGSKTHHQEASWALHIDRGSTAIVKHLFVRKLRVIYKNLNTCDRWFHLIGTRKVGIIFLGPNLKSAVTYIQILIYYSTFVQMNVSQLQSLCDQHTCTCKYVLLVYTHSHKTKTKKKQKKQKKNKRGSGIEVCSQDTHI